MKVERSALLPYSAEQIYRVISDVDAYPEFLNWCESTHIESQEDGQQLASMKVAYGRLKVSFSTRNTLTENEKVDMQLVNGPFKRLSGCWLIKSLDDQACKVTLNMEFQFSNPITHRLFGKVFQSVVSAQIDAFQKRAKSIYG